MIKDFFGLASRNLRKRKLRSWLTMVGIFVSIATIFVLVALSLGLQAAVEKQFEQLGSDKIFIQPGGQLGPPGSTAIGAQLTLDDVDELKKISGVKEVTFWTIGNAKIEFNDKIRYYYIAGMDAEDEQALEASLESFSLEVDEGRFIEKGDMEEVTIGSLYNKRDLFGKDIETRNNILINGEKFKVVGIAKSVGNPADDQNIYMTHEVFQKLFDSGNRVNSIVVQVQEGQNVNEIAEKIEKELDRFRGVNDKSRDYSILTPEELLATIWNILAIITGFLGGIAAISLLVGGIGIANTMYTSVIERTKEIGIMKAVGAENKDIATLFVIESGLLGLMGATIGVVLGFAIGKLIEYIAINILDTSLLMIKTPLWLVVGLLAFGFFVGVVSGFLPALQASKTNVVDTLRYE